MSWKNTDLLGDDKKDTSRIDFSTKKAVSLARYEFYISRCNINLVIHFESTRVWINSSLNQWGEDFCSIDSILTIVWKAWYEWWAFQGGLDLYFNNQDSLQVTFSVYQKTLSTDETLKRIYPKRSGWGFHIISYNGKMKLSY